MILVYYNVPPCTRFVCSKKHIVRFRSRVNNTFIYFPSLDQFDQHCVRPLTFCKLYWFIMDRINPLWFQIYKLLIFSRVELFPYSSYPCIGNGFCFLKQFTLSCIVMKYKWVKYRAWKYKWLQWHEWLVEKNTRCELIQFSRNFGQVIITILLHYNILSLHYKNVLNFFFVANFFVHFSEVSFYKSSNI